MILRTYPSAAPFLACVQPVLEQNEVMHNLLLGLGQRLAEQPGYFNSTPYFVTVEEDESGTGSLLLAGLRTPPYNLILGSESGAYAQALPLLVESLMKEQSDLPGVLSSAPIAEDFTRLWSQQTGVHARLNTRERVYELRQVNPLRRPAGQMRQAGEADLALLQGWFRDFNLEAIGADDPQAFALERVRSRLPDTYLWEDEQPGSLACVARYTPHGAVVGPVYTPPELRGRGYASACVADLSQRLLDSGRQFCALFTNLANPTSNHIYQEIGYQPRGDFSEYRFSID